MLSVCCEVPEDLGDIAYPWTGSKSHKNHASSVGQIGYSLRYLSPVVVRQSDKWPYG